MYTIKEVSEIMGVSEHTLRFWAKNEFFPFVKRDKNNIRRFTDEDLGWVKIVKCLRSVGTDNKSIKKYIDLCLLGDDTIPERFEIIKATKQKALEQFEELKNQLEILDWKENYYKGLVENNRSDIYNPMNNLIEKIAN